MKKLILILLAVFSLSTNAQTFTLSDTTFHVGDSLIRQLDWYYNHSFIPNETKATLDSLAHFFLKHNSLTIKISSHTDSRGGSSYNLALTKGRSETIANYFVSNNISSKRFVTEGLGKGQLIYSDEEINQAKTEEEREYLHAKNRRTVFKIIAL